MDEKKNQEVLSLVLRIKDKLTYAHSCFLLETVLGTLSLVKDLEEKVREQSK